MRRKYKRLAKYCEEVYPWRDVKPGLDIIEKYTSFMENRGPEDADLSLEADFLRAPLIEADILHDVETVSELSTPLLALPCNQLAAHHGSFALWNPEPGHTARRWNLVPNFFLTICLVTLQGTQCLHDSDFRFGPLLGLPTGLSSWQPPQQLQIQNFIFRLSKVCTVPLHNALNMACHLHFERRSLANLLMQTDNLGGNMNPF